MTDRFNRTAVVAVLNLQAILAAEAPGERPVEDADREIEGYTRVGHARSYTPPVGYRRS